MHTLAQVVAIRIMPWFALVITFALGLTGCNHYSEQSIEGWVVDSETKRPIQGVIVVANWQLHRKTSLNGTVPAAHLNIAETRTDRDGLFRFTDWGPRRAKWGFFFDRDPALLLFKDGYEFRSLKNPTPAEVDTSTVRRSVWNGETIEMKKFDGSLDEYASHLSSLHVAMHSILYDSRCKWKSTPSMVSAMVRQGDMFKVRGIDVNLPSLDDVSGYFCGSAENYLKSAQHTIP